MSFIQTIKVANYDNHDGCCQLETDLSFVCPVFIARKLEKYRKWVFLVKLAACFAKL